MVERNNTNLVGFYCWWGAKNCPDYTLGLMADGTFKTYKSPDLDYNMPRVPTGTSYFATG